MGDTKTYMKNVVDQLMSGHDGTSGAVITGVQAYVDQIQDAINPIDGLDAPLVAAALKVVYKGVMDNMPKSGRGAAKSAYKMATSHGVEDKTTKVKHVIKANSDDAAEVMDVIKRHAGDPNAIANALRELGFDVDEDGVWEKKTAKEPEERPVCSEPEPKTDGLPKTEGLM